MGATWVELVVWCCAVRCCAPWNGPPPHVLVRILPQLRGLRSQVGTGGDQPADLCIGVAGEPGEGVGRGMAVPGQRVHLVVREALLDDRG